MITTTATIICPTGIHTRPASAIAKRAKEFTSTITLSNGDKKSDAKSMLQVLKLALACGDVLDITCEGADEAEASRSLTSFINTVTD